MNMPRAALLLPFLPLVAGACSMPGFVATKTIDLTLPATALRELQCDSHNGAITVTGEEGRTAVGLHAELSVRGYTQEEAEGNLAQLEVCRDEAVNSLHVYGRHPVSLERCSPSYSFVLVVPENLGIALTSHNGDLVVRGTRGAARLETHNGDIDGAVTSSHVEATSHNGRVQLHIAGSGNLDGAVTTHNGNVDLQLDEGMDTTLEASTHNGRITIGRKLPEANAHGSSLNARLGSGAGHLVVETHNGDIALR